MATCDPLGTGSFGLLQHWENGNLSWCPVLGVLVDEAGIVVLINMAFCVSENFFMTERAKIWFLCRRLPPTLWKEFRACLCTSAALFLLRVLLLSVSKCAGQRDKGTHPFLLPLSTEAENLGSRRMKMNCTSTPAQQGWSGALARSRQFLKKRQVSG